MTESTEEMNSGNAANAEKRNTDKRRGGPGRGQGRKPVKVGEETVTVSLRMTVAQREKLARLGGGKWARRQIDCAKEPICLQPK